MQVILEDVYNGYEGGVPLFDVRAHFDPKLNELRTFFECASEKLCVKIVKMLLKKRIDITAGGLLDEMLTFASGRGHIESVKLLLGHAANVGVTSRAIVAIHTAVWCGHTEIVTLLLEHGVYEGETGSRSCRLLRVASSGRREEILRLLHEHRNKRDEGQSIAGFYSMKRQPIQMSGFNT